MTQEEKHDLVMQVIDAAIKNGLGVNYLQDNTMLAFFNQENDNQFYYLNGTDESIKMELVKALKYVAEYNAKKVVKHRVALLLTSKSQLSEIQKLVERKGIAFNGLKSFSECPIVFFDQDPEDSKKIWMDMADNMELEYLMEQGWKFLGTYSQGKNDFLYAVNDQN